MGDQILVAAEHMNEEHKKGRRRRVQKPHVALLFALIVVGLGISTFALLVYLSLVAYHVVAGD
jgi:hypothetical protein